MKRSRMPTSSTAAPAAIRDEDPLTLSHSKITSLSTPSRPTAARLSAVATATAWYVECRLLAERKPRLGKDWWRRLRPALSELSSFGHPIFKEQQRREGVLLIVHLGDVVSEPSTLQTQRFTVLLGLRRTDLAFHQQVSDAVCSIIQRIDVNAGHCKSIQESQIVAYAFAERADTGRNRNCSSGQPRQTTLAL